jgi:hypothetical protein
MHDLETGNSEILWSLSLVKLCTNLLFYTMHTRENTYRIILFFITYLSFIFPTPSLFFPYHLLFLIYFLFLWKLRFASLLVLHSLLLITSSPFTSFLPHTFSPSFFLDASFININAIILYVRPQPWKRDVFSKSRCPDLYITLLYLIQTLDQLLYLNSMSVTDWLLNCCWPSPAQSHRTHDYVSPSDVSGSCRYDGCRVTLVFMSTVLQNSSPVSLPNDLETRECVLGLVPRTVCHPIRVACERIHFSLYKFTLNITIPIKWRKQELEERQ